MGGGGLGLVGLVDLRADHGALERRWPLRAAGQPRQPLDRRAAALERTDGLHERARCEHPRGLPHRRLREQHPGVLVEPVPALRAATTRSRRPSSSTARRRPAAARRPRTSAPSTAPSTSTSTSTSASSTSCATASARPAARSRRPTCSRTSTATTSRTSSARLGGGSGGAGATGRSVRTELQADCLAGVWANHAAQTGYLTDLTAGRHRRRAERGRGGRATTASSRRRRAGSTARPWTHGSASQRQHWFTVGYQSGKPGGLRHERLALEQAREQPARRSASTCRRRRARARGSRRRAGARSFNSAPVSRACPRR